MDLRSWSINDDWRDYEHALAPWIKRRVEAVVAWLVGWHCTNGEIARIASETPEIRKIDGKMTANRAKRIVEGLFKRMGVLDRGVLSRRVRCLIEEHRARPVSPVRRRPVRAADGRATLRAAAVGVSGSSVSGMRG